MNTVVAPRGERRATLEVVLVAVLLAGIYLALSLAQPIPTVFGDEFTYQHLARSLANGHGFAWRGDHISLRAALYVYLITPLWALASGVRAYHLAKVETTLIACLTTVPVWLLTRQLLPRRLALLPVLLALTGTWMVVTAGLLTENLALPLATGSLVALVAALRAPGGRLGWLALGLAVLAAWGRLQLAVLVPAILVSLLVDAARYGPAWRERLLEQRALLATLVGLVVLGVVVVAIDGTSVTGSVYSPVLHYSPGPAKILSKSALQLAQLAAMSGFLPVLLTAAVACVPRAWRDAIVGPLLAVIVPVTLVLALQSGFFLAGTTVTWGVERYMAYVVPLMMVLVVVLLRRRDLVGWPVLAGAAALALPLLLTQHMQDFTEERAVAATLDRVHDVVAGASTGVALTAAALLVIGVVAAARRFAPSASAGFGIAIAALFVVLVAQAATAWNSELQLTRKWRTNFPHDLAWIDHHSHGPVSVLEVTSNAVGFEQYDFFNENITGYYAAPGPLLGRKLQGGLCRWRIGGDGSILLQPGCAPATRTFFINDLAGHLTFRNPVAVVRDPHAGELVTVGAGKPRLEALVVTPCDRPQLRFLRGRRRPLAPDAPGPCAASLLAETWLDSPSTLVVRIKGGRDAHSVRLGNQAWPVAAGQPTTLRVAAPAGAAAFQFVLDWARHGPGEPAVVGVDLALGGRTRSLL